MFIFLLFFDIMFNMTSNIIYNQQAFSYIKIKNGIDPFIRPYLKTLYKLEKNLVNFERNGTISLFCRGSLVNYLLFPLQPRPKDFDLLIRINTPYPVGLRDRIELAWREVFRGKNSSPLEQQSSELDHFLLSAHQCGHFEIPNSSDSRRYPLDVTISAINLGQLSPDSTSSADMMEIPIKIAKGGRDFAVYLELSPYAQYLGYKLMEVYNFTSKNCFFVKMAHAQATRNGLFAYTYKLTQGKYYIHPNQAKIEEIYCHVLFSQKKGTDRLESDIRKYMKSHCSGIGNRRLALLFLLNLSDVIMRPNLDRASQKKMIQVVNSIIIGFYQDEVRKNPLSFEQLNALKDKIVAFGKYYFYYVHPGRRIHQSNYLPNTYYCTYTPQEALCIRVSREMQANRGLPWQEWVYYSRASCFFQGKEEDPFLSEGIEPLSLIEESEEEEKEWRVEARVSIEALNLSLEQEQIEEPAPIVNPPAPISSSDSITNLEDRVPIEALNLPLEQEQIEELAPIVNPPAPISSSDSITNLEARVSIEALNLPLEQEPIEELPSIVNPPPPISFLDSINNLKAFLQKIDKLKEEEPLYKLVSKLINLIKKSKKGEVSSDDLEKIVFYFLIELQKTNKAMHICELSEAFCRMGTHLSQESLSYMMDLIVWFFEREDLPRSERLYKCIASRQYEVLETVCSRVVQPQMESKRSKLIVKWILNAFKAKQVGLLAYAQTSLQQQGSTLQTQFISSAYSKACIEGKKLLEAISIDFMKQTPAEERFDFYQKMEATLFSFSRSSFVSLFHHMSLASSDTNGFSACASRGLEHLQKQGIEGIELPVESFNEIFQTKSVGIREQWQALIAPSPAEVPPEEEKGKGVEIAQPKIAQPKTKGGSSKKPIEKRVKKASMPMKEKKRVKDFCSNAEALSQTKQFDLAIECRIKAYELVKKYDMTAKAERESYYSLVFEIGKQYYVDLKQPSKAFPFLKEAYELMKKYEIKGPLVSQQCYFLAHEIGNQYVVLNQKETALPFFLEAFEVIKKYNMTLETVRKLYSSLAFEIGKQYTDLNQYEKALPFLREAFKSLYSTDLMHYLIAVLSKLERSQMILDFYAIYRAKSNSSLSWMTHCYIGKAYVPQNASKSFLHFAMAFNALVQARQVDSKELEMVLEYMQGCQHPDYHSNLMVKSLVLQVMKMSSEIAISKRNNDQLPLLLKHLASYLQRN